MCLSATATVVLTKYNVTSQPDTVGVLTRQEWKYHAPASVGGQRVIMVSVSNNKGKLFPAKLISFIQSSYQFPLKKSFETLNEHPAHSYFTRKC